jgi:hypothetical protein
MSSAIQTKFVKFLGEKVNSALNSIYSEEQQREIDPKKVEYIKSLSSGFYWYREPHLSAWEIVQVEHHGEWCTIYMIGNDCGFMPEEMMGEWGEKIEWKQ